MSAAQFLQGEVTNWDAPACLFCAFLAYGLNVLWDRLKARAQRAQS